MSKVVKPKKKTKNYYFDQITENAIIRYNNTDDARLKNKIYSEQSESSEDFIGSVSLEYVDIEKRRPHLQPRASMSVPGKDHQE